MEQQRFQAPCQVVSEAEVRSEGRAVQVSTLHHGALPPSTTFPSVFSLILMYIPLVSLLSCIRLSYSFLSAPACLLSGPPYRHLSGCGVDRRHGLVPRATRESSVSSDPSSSDDFCSRSYVRSLRSSNLAGVVGDQGQDIYVPFGAHLTVVTGETGSGKSLLVARALQLVCGSKASPSLLKSATNRNDLQNLTAFAQVEVVLGKQHLSSIQTALQVVGVPMAEGNAVHLRRTLQVQSSGTSKARLKSVCEINGRQVSLKALATFARPLFAIVDASVASSALARPESRMAVLDTAVSRECMERFHQTKSRYRLCRQAREQIEQALASRILPPSFSRENGKDNELLVHWIDELDAFERRVVSFCQSLLVGEPGDSELAAAAQELAKTTWTESSSKSRSPFSSVLLQRLTKFRDVLAFVDSQETSLRSALLHLGSLSSPNSAVTAVERARELLFDAAGGSGSSKNVATSLERAHDLLNAVEKALAEVTDFMDDEKQGPISVIEFERSACRVSIEDVDGMIQDWNTLARKHAIPAFSLPSCHAALRAELDGNVEAQTQLPMALADEAEAQMAFAVACASLSDERRRIAKQLSSSVTERLPALGMDKAALLVEIAQSRACTEWLAYGSPGSHGIDSINFVLRVDGESQGLVHDVASSGEKARLLLAIECALPGSVGASCGGNAEEVGSEGTVWSNAPPVVVLYDEIDAHVGGHAAVSIAGMLVDQSTGGSQVIAITHNPSVAAVADSHLVVSRISGGPDVATSVRVRAVDGLDRRKELARMASGDLAMEEAEIFADALIRDGAKRRLLKP